MDILIYEYRVRADGHHFSSEETGVCFMEGNNCRSTRGIIRPELAGIDQAVKMPQFDRNFRQWQMKCHATRDHRLQLRFPYNPKSLWPIFRRTASFFTASVPFNLSASMVEVQLHNGEVVTDLTPLQIFSGTMLGVTFSLPENLKTQVYVVFFFKGIDGLTMDCEIATVYETYPKKIDPYEAAIRYNSNFQQVVPIQQPQNFQQFQQPHQPLPPQWPQHLSAYPAPGIGPILGASPAVGIHDREEANPSTTSQTISETNLPWLPSHPEQVKFGTGYDINPQATSDREPLGSLKVNPGPASSDNLKLRESHKQGEKNHNEIISSHDSLDCDTSRLHFTQLTDHGNQHATLGECPRYPLTPHVEPQVTLQNDTSFSDASANGTIPFACNNSARNQERYKVLDELTEGRPMAVQRELDSILPESMWMNREAFLSRWNGHKKVIETRNGYKDNTVSKCMPK
ncbi:hypothetical protein BGZ63DRAFT_148770 [Mariannaea sp. PMI_226]|nr:hypothetical protein BGZ63DRAFT_148770 [Mariannaea sp. PMI_226]